MRVYITEQELKIIREMIDYEDLHLKKLIEYEEKAGAPQLQCNIIKYLSKKALARRVDFIMCIKTGDNDLTTEQAAALAHMLEQKMERDVKATHKLYKRTDAEGVIENLAREELIPTFLLLDKFRDY